MPDLSGYLPVILARHLPGRQIVSVIDRGAWIRHIFEVRLDGDEIVFVKFQTHSEWFDTTLNDKILSEMLRARGISASEVIAADKSKTLAPNSYVIEKKGSGARLDKLLDTANRPDRDGIFRAIGSYYCAMHQIPGPRAGVFIDDPNQPLELHPVDFYLQNELKQGSGLALVEAGRLPKATWERVVQLWEENLSFLKSSPARLVHGSPFGWTINLEKSGDAWRVTRISAMGDLLWWDPDYNNSLLRYPPFHEENAEDWAAFIEGYGSAPDERRMRLYALLTHIMAANGVFSEPQTPENAAWRAGCLKDLDLWIQALE